MFICLLHLKASEEVLFFSRSQIPFDERFQNLGVLLWRYRTSWSLLLLLIWPDWPIVAWLGHWWAGGAKMQGFINIYFTCNQMVKYLASCQASHCYWVILLGHGFCTPSFRGNLHASSGSATDLSKWLDCCWERCGWIEGHDWLV